jgi:hypothetical protein
MPMPPIPQGVVTGEGLREYIRRYHEALARTLTAMQPVAVTTLTNANPMVLTASSIAVGDVVTFVGMTGDYAALNGGRYRVGTGMTIDVDGSGFAPFSLSGVVQRV